MGFWSSFFSFLNSPVVEDNMNCRIQIRTPNDMGFWRDYGSTTASTASYDIQSVKRGYYEDVSVRAIDSRGRVLDMIQ